MRTTLFFISIAWLAAAACTRPNPVEAWEAPELPHNLSFPTFEDNPTTVPGVLLGRKLFFDAELSQPRGVSCMSCHRPGMAFTDGLSVSQAGVSGKPLMRNSPTLINLAWAPAFFWDGGAKDLESQAYGPLQHPDEMGIDLETMEAYLRRHEEYPPLFRAAFGLEADVDNVEVVRALAQYQRTLVSFNTPWDAYTAGDTTAMESMALEGWAVFQQRCTSCHTPPLFTDHRYHNNGLDTVFPADEERVFQGRYRISLDSADLGKYRTPTLRNVARTAPYMHDGRFGTLEAVLDHYAQGVHAYPTLAPELQNGGITLTEQERTAVLAFLREGLSDSDLPH